MSSRAYRVRVGTRRWAGVLLLGAGVAPGLVAPSCARAQESRNLLRWYVEGPRPDSLPERRDPGRLIGKVEVQRLLLAVRENPRSAGFIANALAGTELSLGDLLAAQLLREQPGVYELGFPLITEDDAQRLLEVSERFARSLADAYLARRPDIEGILRRYPVPHIEPAELAFILVGCFSLDWDGLRLTQELGYRTVRREAPPIVRWAIVSEATRPKAIYWGSHNEYLSSGVVFTSFGDFHSLPRTALPDLLWMMQRGPQATVAIPEGLRPAVQAVAGRNLEELMQQLGSVMMTLRQGGKTPAEVTEATGLDASNARELLTLLEGLEYVLNGSGRYATAIAVFADEDREMVTDLTDLSRRVMAAWLEDNYEAYKAALMQVTTIGHSLPFEATFWNVWHWLFGTVNRILVEDGLFADPYGAGRRYKGFVPVVWHRYATVAP